MMTKQCSFCQAIATTEVDDESGFMPACQQHYDDWQENPGFCTDLEKVALWLREQAEKGAVVAMAAEEGSTRRAAYGGGSYALKCAADEIEQRNIPGLTHPRNLNNGE